MTFVTAAAGVWLLSAAPVEVEVDAMVGAGAEAIAEVAMVSIEFW